MAANLLSRRVVGTGKRFVRQIRTDQTDQPIALSFRRTVHESVYNKNLDEHVRPTVVPDEFMPLQSDKYWAPHPKTGVFGPASEDNPAAGSPSANASEESVLEQKAFFRPLEDLDKPLQ